MDCSEAKLVSAMAANMRPSKEPITSSFELHDVLTGYGEEEFRDRSPSHDSAPYDAPKKFYMIHQCPATFINEAMEREGKPDRLDVCQGSCKLWSWHSADRVIVKGWMHLLRKNVHADFRGQLEDDASGSLLIDYLQDAKVYEAVATAKQRDDWRSADEREHEKKRQKRRKTGSLVVGNTLSDQPSNP